MQIATPSLRPRFIGEILAVPRTVNSYKHLGEFPFVSMGVSFNHLGAPFFILPASAWPGSLPKGLTARNAIYGAVGGGCLIIRLSLRGALATRPRFIGASLCSQ